VDGRLELADRQFIARWLADEWGLPIVTMRREYMPEQVEGLVYVDESGEKEGLITWYVEDDLAEIVTLDAFEQGRHIGGRLLDGAEGELRRRGARRVFITTTNDNLRAIAFYTRRGYRLMRIELDGMDRVRERKPLDSSVGMDGISLQDMFEFEKELKDERFR
jgi:GNAT superfamily N-acetyltransferase